MNYLNFKNPYPKSINKFFCWVSKQNPNDQNEYVDNAYFHQFFLSIFEFSTGDGITIRDEHQIDILEPILTKKLYKDNLRGIHKSNITIQQYIDPSFSYIRIRLNQESDYENAFYVLETLINNGFYA